MPVPPPTQDLEARLRRLADVLDAAIDEVRSTIDDIRAGGDVPPVTDPKGAADDDA